MREGDVLQSRDARRQAPLGGLVKKKNSPAGREGHPKPYYENALRLRRAGNPVASGLCVLLMTFVRCGCVIKFRRLLVCGTMGFA